MAKRKKKKKLPKQEQTQKEFKENKENKEKELKENKEKDLEVDKSLDKDKLICPICKFDLESKKVYYCPKCNNEIDYLLWADKMDITEEEINNIKKGKSSIMYNSIVALGTYAIIVTFVFLYFIISKQ